MFADCHQEVERRALVQKQMEKRTEEVKKNKKKSEVAEEIVSRYNNYVLVHVFICNTVTL